MKGELSMQRPKRIQSFLTLTATIALSAATPDSATAGMEPFVGMGICWDRFVLSSVDSGGRLVLRI
jgi:hypothetical protein